MKWVQYAEVNYIHGSLKSFFWKPSDRDSGSAVFPWEDSADRYTDRYKYPATPHLLQHGLEFSLDSQTHPIGRDRNTQWEAFRERMFAAGRTASWRRMYISQPPVYRVCAETIPSKSCIPLRVQIFSSPVPGRPIVMQDLVRKLGNDDLPCAYAFKLEGVVSPHPTNLTVLNQRAIVGDLGSGWSNNEDDEDDEDDEIEEDFDDPDDWKTDSEDNGDEGEGYEWRTYGESDYSEREIVDWDSKP